MGWIFIVGSSRKQANNKIREVESKINFQEMLSCDILCDMK
jgi:hypothetical protein